MSAFNGRNAAVYTVTAVPDPMDIEDPGVEDSGADDPGSDGD